MKTYIALACTLLFCVKIYALDLNAVGKKALDDVSKELQKSKIIPVNSNPFNREVGPTLVPKAGEFWVGIVGDSSTTGAAASPDFHATWNSVLNHLMMNLPPREQLVSPIRVMYTPAEFKQAQSKNQALELNQQAEFSQKIDTEEYSFGYAIAQKIGLSPDKLVMTGQDGTRVSSIAAQFNRLLAVGAPALPPLVIVSYVANDLCHPDNFANPVERFRTSYEAILKQQFEQVATLPAAQQGTRVVFVAPLDISNVLTNPNLLSQKIRMEGNKDITCQQLRDGSVGGNDFAKMMTNSLRGECRGILARTDNPAAQLAQLKALQDAQAAALVDAIAQFNARNLGIKMEYAASAKAIDFQPGDLANDCFHPGKAGAERIADQLLRNELSNVKP